MQTSDHRYLEKVVNNCGRGLNIEALKTDVLIRGLFMSTTTKAAVHLRPNYTDNLKLYRNTNFEELPNLFDITQMLIHHQAEMLNVSPIDWTVPSWTRSTLAHDQVITWTKAQVSTQIPSHFGEEPEHSEANKRWKNQLEKSRQVGIDGEPSEFEWSIFPGLASLQFLQEIQKTCKIEMWNLRLVKIESSSCQFSMISIGQREGTRNMYFKFRTSQKYATRFSRGQWTFIGPGDEKKWYGTLSFTPEGKWDSIATQMVERFKETGLPVFQNISTLSRGFLKRKNGRDTTRFNADSSNKGLLFRTIHPANQHSIYGAVSSWCNCTNWDRCPEASSAILA